MRKLIFLALTACTVTFPTILIRAKPTSKHVPQAMQSLQHLARSRATRSQLERWMHRTFDVSHASKLLLGPHATHFHPEQRREFDSLLEALLVRQLRAQLQTVEEFTLTCLPRQGVTVSCTMENASTAISLTFALTHGHGARIYDVRAARFHFIRDNRMSIDRSIRSGGVEGLLRSLRHRLK